MFRSAAMAGIYYWISSGYEAGKKWARILMLSLSCLNIAVFVYLVGWEENLPKGYSVVYILLGILFMAVMVLLIPSAAASPA